MEIQAEKPFDTAELPIISTTEANNLVLEQAGATKPMRDAIDIRVIEEVKSGTGKIPDYPVYENLPILAKGEPYPDKDGYTNLEEFLNESDPFLI